MVKKIVILSCTAFMLAAVPAFDGAYAQQGQGRNWRSGQSDGYGLYRGCPLNLVLTQEQSAKIQALHNTFFKDTIALRSDIFKKKQELDALMLAPAIEDEKAHKIQDKISSLRTQFARKRLQAQLDARKVLTPDQIGLLPPGYNMGIGPNGKGLGFGFDGDRNADDRRR